MKLIRLAATFFAIAIILISDVASAEKPNVLFIAVDDLNDFAGYRGNPEVISPNIDRLASNSTWFSKAYCQYPVCGPSRASVMSGMYFHQLGSKKLQVKDDFVKEKAESFGSQLLHDYLKSYGYKTMAVGKILHRHLPTESLDMSGGRGSWNHNKDKNGKDIESNFKSDKTLTDWAPYQGKESRMSDHKAAKWAAERLKEKHDQPFMLMVGFLRPHTPWHVPQKYLDMYDPKSLTPPPYRKDDFDDIPEAAHGVLNKGYPRTEWALEKDQWQNILQAYYASITFADRKIGNVLDALDASPYRNNTIVVLWSDHGYHMGEKNTFQKHTLWERSASAQLMISLPKSMRGKQRGRKKQGAQCDRVVSLLDIYPTLVELCGLPANDKVFGRSLTPLLADSKTEWDYPALTYRKQGGKSVRDERYRYIEYGDGSSELYDSEEDPNEWTNLAENAAFADVLNTMREKLAKYHVN